MARGYLIFVLVAGMFSWILGGAMSRGPSKGENGFEQRVKDAHLVARSSDSSKDSSSEEAAEEGTIALDRSADGHFYADVQINGATVRALVDTGATGIALSREDARSAGVATSIGMNEVIGRGADGDVRGEFVNLDSVSLGHKRVEGMRAIVLNSGETSLLGQSFLAKFDSVEIQGDRMVLR